MNTKHLRTLCLSALLLGSACGSDDSGDGSKDPGKEQQQLKAEVRAACEQADDDGTTRPLCPDVWLGDGVCDDFCQGGDADDCTVHCDALGCTDDDGDDGIVCPAIWSEPDGECDEDDPCGPFTDGDCQGAGDGDGDDGVACIEIQYPANDVCEAAVGCEYTDLDCATCTESYPKDGCCDATSICANHDPDCGIACTADVRDTDDVCNAEFCDPDCRIACAERGDGDDPVCDSDDPADCEVHATNR